jgi:hypothetical protein
LTTSFGKAGRDRRESSIRVEQGQHDRHVRRRFARETSKVGPAEFPVTCQRHETTGDRHAAEKYFEGERHHGQSVKRARGEASDLFSDTHEGGGKRPERVAERDALRHRGHQHRRPCERRTISRAVPSVPEP